MSGAAAAMSELRFNVFGRLIAVARQGEGWAAWQLGADGKRRRADFEVPQFIADAELCQYLADLFHEAATPGHGEVFQVR